MLLSVFLFVLILAIAFFQSTQGVFSALIMTVQVICCTAFAMYSYEWVATHWLAGWKPDYAYALAMAGTFGLSLLLLRIVYDKAAPRAPLVPRMVDRIGGAVCGLVTGLAIVGMLALSLQQIPFGGNVFGFTRIDRHVKKQPVKDGDPELRAVPLEQAQRELFLTPDRFAVKLAALTSAGVFSGERKLGKSEPDLVEHIGWVNSVPAPVSQYAEEGSVEVLKTFPVDYIYDFKHGVRRLRGESTDDTYEQIKPKPGHEYWAVRLKLKQGARGTDKSTYFTFSLRQIRIVGKVENRLEHYTPLAIQAADPAHAGRHTAATFAFSQRFHVVDDLFKPLAAAGQEIEVVFELPMRFDPDFIEYKRGARVPVELGVRTAPPATDAPPTSTQSASASSTPTQPASGGTAPPAQRAGRVRGYTTKMQSSYFGDELPFPLSTYTEGINTEIRRGVITEGSVSASTDAQQEDAPSALKKFEVPGDKRLLHLTVGSLQAQSLFGRALGSAVEVAQNFTVGGDGGQVYKIIGKYALAKVENDEVFELQYFPNQIGTIGGVRAFSRIQKRHLDEDAELVFLFLIDPGVKIEYFSTGGRANRRDDLSGENLVAPN